MNNDIIRIGKVPVHDRFNYRKALQLIDKCSDDSKLKVLNENLEIIVRKIEKQMKLSEKIRDYNPKEWKYMIDDDFNFWMMKNEYIERNFIFNKKKKE